MVRRIAEEGHSVGNHGFRDQAHPVFGRDPFDTAQGIVVTQEILERLTGRRPKLFRLPRARPRRDIWRAIRREGMTTVHASLFSLSESRESPRSLHRRIVRRAKSGDIILLHDWPGAAEPAVLKALPGMIEGIEERGFGLVTVPELLTRQ
jgi:peptidoglycan/xylan/chitin deacetylase (PgdA/CDA1 family)